MLYNKQIIDRSLYREISDWGFLNIVFLYDIDMAR